MDDPLVNGGLASGNLRSNKEHPRPSSIAWWWTRQRHWQNASSHENSTVGALRSSSNRRLLNVLVVLFVLAAGAMVPAIVHAVRGPLKGAAAKEAALVAMATRAIAELPPHRLPPHKRGLTTIPFRVAIAGIVRDDAASLPRMMALVEEIGALFLEYRVVIVENDSCDGTSHLLHAWAKRNRRVVADTHSFKAQMKRPSHGFLASRRNRYLDLIMGKAKNAQKSGASSRRRPNVHNHSDPLIGDTARSGDGVATKLRHTNQRRRRRTNDKLQGTYRGPPNGWWHGGCNHGSCVRNAPSTTSSGSSGEGSPALSDCELVLVVDMDLLAIDTEGLRLSVLAWLRAVADDSEDSSSTSGSSGIPGTTGSSSGSDNSRHSVTNWQEIANDGRTRSLSSASSSSSYVPSLQFPREAKGWGGIAANGVTQDGRYFDIFALRARKSTAEGSSMTRPFLEWPPSRGVLFQDPIGRDLIRANQVDSTVPYHPLQSSPFGIDSAFSGLAIYRRDAIRGCRYDSGEFNDCEHVAFHQCLASNMQRAMKQRAPGLPSSYPSFAGNFALGVAPRMVVTYNLPCDPGPNVSVADGCFGNPAKSAEIQRFRDLQLQLLSPPGSGRLL